MFFSRTSVSYAKYNGDNRTAIIMEPSHTALDHRETLWNLGWWSANQEWRMGDQLIEWKKNTYTNSALALS